jgi:tetraacyldisaccharide 4'-kinase
MNRSRMLKIISGETTGFSGSLVRGVLGGLEPVYRLAVSRRNRKFDRKPGSSQKVAAAVISIGNLTTGGTGKTPIVRWVVEQLKKLDERAAIVSRGYGSKNGQPNDEWEELAMYLPEVPHLQNMDRVAAAQSVIRQHKAKAIILDDGFQHRRLSRDLDVVLIDATCPFGYNHLLPRGLLREPIGSLDRADAVVITRVDQVSGDRLAEIAQEICRWIPADRVAKVSFCASELLDGKGVTRPLSEIHGERIVGFCGLGNPAAFRQTLKDNELEPVDFVEWPDHHRYEATDILRLHAIARARDARALVCTVKDLVKVRELPECGFPVYAVTVRPKFLAGESMLRELIAQTICKFRSESH